MTSSCPHVRSLLRTLLVGLALCCLSAPLVPPAAHAADHRGKASSSDRHRAVRGTLVALPPIVRSASARTRTSSLVATFEPAVPGRVVTLERRVRGGWRRVARAVEDDWGSAAFTARPGTYRARTTRKGRTWRSGTVRARPWRAEFADEFDGSALKPVWNDQKREHESVYAPRTCARVTGSVRRVDNGVLHLGIGLDPERIDQTCAYSSRNGPGTSPYLLNTQVATEFTRSFKHGIVAARIKPQRARGIHTGFWLLPVGTTYVDGNPAAGAEIDVVEYFGATDRGDSTIASSIHYYDAGWDKVSHGGPFPEARNALGDNSAWWDEFHVFSVEWTADAYIFRVDGREYYREKAAVSKTEQYLVLSALTSDYELAELTADELDDTAQVDWVRVYAATSRGSSRTTRGRSAAR